MTSQDPICFQCGQRVTNGPLLNRMEDGLPCPVCSDRLMAALPPLLPGGFQGAEEMEVGTELEYDPLDDAPPAEPA